MKCFEIGDPLQVLEKLTILTVNMKCFEIQYNLITLLNYK